MNKLLKYAIITVLLIFIYKKFVKENFSFPNIAPLPSGGIDQDSFWKFPENSDLNPFKSNKSYNLFNKWFIGSNYIPPPSFNETNQLIFGYNLSPYSLAISSINDTYSAPLHSESSENIPILILGFFSFNL